MSANPFTIIATVPNMERVEAILGAEGARPDYFRLNLSHCTVQQAVDFLTAYNQRCGDIPIFLDLQGSKIRLLREQPTITVNAGEEVVVCSAPIAGKTCLLVDAQVVRTCIEACGTHPSITALIDDGKVELRLLHPTSDAFVPATVVRGGKVLPRKGFNLSPHPICLTTLTTVDHEFVVKTRVFPCVRYALSFVSDPREIVALRETVGRDAPCSRHARGCFVAAKLERALSVAETRALGAVSDEMWLCRGDMGSQLGLPGLAQFYRAFVHVMPSFGCPVILAGEVLDHMPMAGISTRSEVCHLADAVERGYTGCVLSNETVCPSTDNALAAIRLVRAVTAAAQADRIVGSPFGDWWAEAQRALAEAKKH
ncbi:putative pyruvate kinase [Paratrimastix pyriformis]|uniref:Pyruvate kinase n=1 Tax=Paratrimastix pyriformis TaxID=342808 RepID=A0ABQ8UQU1_9EUKA|nr:putative pyruvate kinase [Paratrimastix pyriformis]